VIGAWLVYAFLVGGLLAIAAGLAEAALRARGISTRWVWLIAMITTIGLAGIAPSRESARVAAEPLVMSTVETTASLATPGGRSTGLLARMKEIVGGVRAGWEGALTSASAFVGSPRGQAIGRILLIGWVLSSALLVIAYVVTTMRTSRQCRTWPVAEVEGVSVRISPRLGPLVMGIVRPEIVVPRWLLGADARERRLVLAHEQEHLRRADPVLLAMGWFFAALLPWHPAAWWMLSRLRLAIEADCDARVLRAGVDRATYGAMLIDIAERRTGGLVGAPALLGGYSQLERRLHMMTQRSTRFSGVRSLLLGAASGAIALAACDADVPTAAEIADMDVTAAEEQLHRIAGPTPQMQYFVDGAQVSAERARALAPDQIASIRVIGSSRVNEEPGISQVVVATKEGAESAGYPGAAERAQRILVRAQEEAGLQPGEEARGQLVLIRGGSDGDEPVVLVQEGDQIRRIDLRRVRAMSPDRIESIDVIKDPVAARAVFDAPEAENGVIRIRLRATGYRPDPEAPQGVLKLEADAVGYMAPSRVRAGDSEP
jgi:beta-lactamase regulating signal transducer with metallopeptidase domain